MAVIVGLALMSSVAYCSFSIAQVEPSEKVIKGSTFGAEPTSLAIDLAGDEYESLQLVLWNQSAGLTGVQVKIEGLPSDIGLFCDVYKVKYISVTGEDWPDPLIKLAGPMSISVEDGLQPFMLRFYAKNDAVPGTYNGLVKVIADGETTKSIPISVKIRKFSLPRPGHLPFGILMNDMPQQVMHESRMQSLDMAWGTVGVPNMILEDDGSITCDWEEWKARVLAFEARKGGPVLCLGWRFDYPYDTFIYNFTINKRSGGTTTVCVDPRNGGADKARFDSIMSGYQTALTAIGWADKAYFFVDDEASGQTEFNELAAFCDYFKAAAPAIKTMVTNSYPFIPLYQPLLSVLEGKVDAYVQGMWAFDPTTTPGKISAAGGELWMYNVAFSANPSLLIPTNSAQLRYWPWLANRHSAKGLLNWRAMVSIYTFDNPGDDGRGEGLLFYPASEDRSGVLTTIRAETIREGLEDYEYIYLLKQHSTPEATALLDEALNIVPGGHQANMPASVVPAIYLKSRIGDYLDSVTP